MDQVVVLVVEEKAVTDCFCFLNVVICSGSR